VIWVAASVLFETRWCTLSAASGVGSQFGGSSAFVTDLWTRLGALFPPNAFPDVAAVQSRWAEVEREQVEFVNRVTNESLGRMVPVRTTQISLAHLMQHLANHSTYHRGQVVLKMRQLAAAPVATDFALFLLEGRREAADAR
jgi:uncharacterized damage-inducible protein DinB